MGNAKYTWYACSNSSYLAAPRRSSSLRQAMRDAREYLLYSLADNRANATIYNAGGDELIRYTKISPTRVAKHIF